tara:strand:+ start:61 stop:840 length:780 start_codon:yes stop_codon:yes gene_type:complete
MITWRDKKVADAGFIINLKHREDRIETAYNALDKLGFAGVERFDAVVIDEYPFKNQGCTQSHIEIAKMQIENNWQYVLYLEDDIVDDVFYEYDVVDNINIDSVILEMIENIDKFSPDVLWLGVRPEGKVKRVSNILIEPSKTIMSHAYIGSLKYANFLVDNFDWSNDKHITWLWPIDFFISELNVKGDWKLYEQSLIGASKFLNNDLNVYMLLPNIFTQNKSYSDIQKKHVDYRKWIRVCFKKYVDLDLLKITKKLLNE